MAVGTLAVRGGGKHALQKIEIEICNLPNSTHLSTSMSVLSPIAFAP